MAKKNAKTNKNEENIDNEMHKIFFQESAVNFEESEKNYLAMSTEPTNETIEQALRLSHNLKGSAKAVGFYDISDILHNVEELLILFKNNLIEFNQEFVTLLLECNDRVKYIVEKLKINPSYKANYEDILLKINEYKTKSPSLPKENVLEDDITFLDEVDLVKTEEEKEEKEEKIVDTQKRRIKKVEDADEMIRVSIGKVNKLQEYIGELVILESMLKEQLKVETSNVLKNLFRQMDKITKEVQDIVMSLRLVPILPVFQKLMRTSRDISIELNKKIITEFNGDNTEIDKSILDEISDPLIHMMRNAIDHGIENSEERLAKGKNIEGKITVSAMHEGRFLLIKFADDGKGLDPALLKQKAIEKGLINKDTVLSIEKCFDLIFLPGFSTKTITTDISGRGFGMDIVKNNIENIGGNVQIISQINKGTEFIIRIPLTIGILDAFIVQVKEEKYVIPVQQVRESISYKKSDVNHVQGLGDILTLRQEEIPIYHLGYGLNTPKYQQNNNEEKVIIILQNRDKKIGVVVDNIINIQSVVTKTFGDELRCEQGITGGVILGDGIPVPIIEVADLIEGNEFKKCIAKVSSNNLHKAE
ncbi:chemotaxis protein CheA [Fluviispira vulneris]|uniref:chemotaxis protein CheA n=1 Tax=Fluviispira vulneris TaxID=2763012 RepID=UPI00164681BF|nr:chemotaxis protein CheA [Fluviispira vulneris]